ncbi:MAG: chlorophyll a/b-binding protein [Cyanobacteria bacterium P01_F01_bin.53]
MTVNSSSENTPETQQAGQDAAGPGFGWTQYAEQINGRFAMIGFVAVLVMELFTQQDFFTWIGLR